MSHVATVSRRGVAVGCGVMVASLFALALVARGDELRWVIFGLLAAAAGASCTLTWSLLRPTLPSGLPDGVERPVSAPALSGPPAPRPTAMPVPIGSGLSVGGGGRRPTSTPIPIEAAALPVPMPRSASSPIPIAAAAVPGAPAAPMARMANGPILLPRTGPIALPEAAPITDDASDNAPAAPHPDVAALTAQLERLEAQGRERERQLEQAHAKAVSLSRFAEWMQSISNAHEIQTALATVVESTLPDSTVQVVQCNDARDRLDVTWPPAPDDTTSAVVHPVQEEPLRCRALRTRKMVRADAGSATACDCSLGVPDEGGYACVPMVIAGDAVGLVNIQTRRQRAWPRRDLLVAQAYVNFAASSLTSIRLLAAARERALRDSLTGAYNRRFFEEYLIRRLSECARSGAPTSLLLLDLDHFKRLNDTYGHQVGDRVLVAFASCVQELIRAGDVLVRFGGEEFVVVLPNTDGPGARIVAERIRSRVEALVIATGDKMLGSLVRVSIGLATAPIDASAPDTLVAAADQALYRAKAAGRNRVESADTLRAAAAAMPSVGPDTN
jgi:diguanylate cyclase (GGDEF)-like protein